MKTIYLILIVILANPRMVNAQGTYNRIVKHDKELAVMVHDDEYSTMIFANAAISDGTRAKSCQKTVAFTLDSTNVKVLYNLMVNHVRGIRHKHTMTTLDGKVIKLEYARENKELYPILHLYDGDVYYRLQYMTKEVIIKLFSK